MSLRVAPRSPALRSFVQQISISGTDLPEGRERAVPTADMTLMVNLAQDEFRTYEDEDGDATTRTGGAILQGPLTRPTIIDSAELRSLVTVGFRFGGAPAFFALPLGLVENELVDMDELWGSEGACLRDRLLDAATPVQQIAAMEEALLVQLRPGARRDHAMAAAVGCLREGRRVKDVADRLGMLPKTFGQRFRSAIGVTPKRFARVCRLQRLLDIMPTGEGRDWASLAIAAGFYDQSHLVHEFRSLTGLSPTEYAPRSIAVRNHVPVSPAGA